MTAPLTGEEEIIQHYLAPLAAHYPGAFGLRDDCAAITPPPGCDLVVKTDPVRAGVHFFPDDAPEDIAWKALAVNVSDLAAKGAKPLAYLAALSFPNAPEPEWMSRFASGLASAQKAFGCHLIGGDTDRAPGPLTVAITAFGSVGTGRMVRRGTARPGDVVFVSGTLGAAALGLKLRRGDVDTLTWPLESVQRAQLVDRYLRPQPRLALTPALLAHATAAMDLSDGLHKDFDRLCRASDVGGRIDVSLLPIDDASRTVFVACPDVREIIWSGGDDYEILCSMPEERADEFVSDAARAAVAVTRIGVMTAARPCVLHDSDGQPIARAVKGFDHF